MARRHKFTGAEWHEIFRKAVEYCKVRARQGVEKFQECMSRVLHEAYETGKVPTA